MLATTLGCLQERGKAALKHFTEGQVQESLSRARSPVYLSLAQFAECATVFRAVLQQLLLVVADEAGDADACKELLAQSRDYLIAVRFSSPSLQLPAARAFAPLIHCLQVIIETQRRIAEKDRCAAACLN
jgi:hypothetical protein